MGAKCTGNCGAVAVLRPCVEGDLEHCHSKGIAKYF